MIEMENRTLRERYAEHFGKVSDKWSIYLDVYQRLFLEYATRPISLLEIGIQNGGSLEIWSKHFPHARTLVGCDINPACAQLTYDDPRIHVIVGDANSCETEEAIAKIENFYDVVIDDGSHVSRDIVRSFCRYFPRIPEGGIFVAEDLHCSYWAEFGGGLYDPLSSVAFFKCLSDIANYEHWGIPGARADLVNSFFSAYGCSMDESEFAKIHSVEFINSVCVVRKLSPKANELGPRIFAGSVDIVSAERPEFSEAKPYTPNQQLNRWSQLANPPDLQLEKAIRELSVLAANIDAQNLEMVQQREAAAELERQLNDMRIKFDADNSSLKSRILAMEQSRSWRITRPLRYVKNLLA